MLPDKVGCRQRARDAELAHIFCKWATDATAAMASAMHNGGLRFTGRDFSLRRKGCSCNLAKRCVARGDSNSESQNVTLPAHSFANSATFPRISSASWTARIPARSVEPAALPDSRGRHRLPISEEEFASESTRRREPAAFATNGGSR